MYAVGCLLFLIRLLAIIKNILLIIIVMVLNKNQFGNENSNQFPSALRTITAEVKPAKNMQIDPIPIQSSCVFALFSLIFNILSMFFFTFF